MAEKKDQLKYAIYIFSILFIYTVYFLAFIGITIIDKSKLHLFSIILELTICALLIIRFNPYTTHQITEFDKIVIFEGSVFLFVSLFITEVYSQYRNYIIEILRV